MSLVKSLNAGVSGLNAFQAKMDVIGNNIANVDTAGFKSSSITFAEMMNQNLGRETVNLLHSLVIKLAWEFVFHQLAVILRKVLCKTLEEPPI